jgi:putative ABC transport system ATP-binding protein
VDELGQTTVMVTHDPRAAAMADRILFIADGLIVKDISESTAVEVLAAMQEVTGSPSRASRPVPSAPF